MIKNSCLTILVFLLLQNVATPQTANIDSLLNELAKAKEDTNKINTLNVLAWNLIISANYKSALEFGEEAMLLSEKLKFQKGKAFAYQNLGYAYSNQFNYSKDSGQ